MGLKDDILKAFEKNLTHDKVNQEGEIETIKPAIGRGTPLDTLATELRDAFIDFLVKQDFNITEMEAPYKILPNKINTLVNGGTTPTAAGPMPILNATGVGSVEITGIAQISETSNKIQNKDVPTAVKKSKVKLISVKDA